MDREAIEEIKRHFGVVAEGQQSSREEIARDLQEFRQEVRAEFQGVKAMIKFSYAELDLRGSWPMSFGGSSGHASR